MRGLRRAAGARPRPRKLPSKAAQRRDADIPGESQLITMTVDRRGTILQFPLEVAGRYRRIGVATGRIGVVLYLALTTMHASTRKPWNDEAAPARAGFNLGGGGLVQNSRIQPVPHKAAVPPAAVPPRDVRSTRGLVLSRPWNRVLPPFTGFSPPR